MERRRLRSVLREHFEIIEASNIDELIRCVQGRAPSVVLLEFVLPKHKAMDHIQLMRQLAPTTEVIALSAAGSPSYAVAAVKAGAFGFLSKDDDDEAVLAVAFEAIEHGLAAGGAHRPADETVPGSICPAVLKNQRRLAELAASGQSVVVSGEIGTGRKTFARALHARSLEPGVLRFVDCAELTHQSLTTALSIVGSAPASDAAALHNTVCLLNVERISTQDCQRLGELAAGPVLVRLRNNTCVTVRHRAIAVSDAGRDAQSLTESLNTCCPGAVVWAQPIELVPLRSRLEDLPQLCAHLAGRWSRRYRLPCNEVGAEALEVMATYAWPANILELSNVLERLSLTLAGGVIDASALPLELHIGSWRRGLSYRSAIQRLEREFLRRVIERSGGCRRRAAERLQLSYSTLKFRLRKLAG